MVRENRIGQTIDGKDTGEKLQPITNPLSAMFERAAANRILPAQKRPPHAPIDQMQHLHFVWINAFPACLPRHLGSPIVSSTTCASVMGIQLTPPTPICSIGRWLKT